MDTDPAEPVSPTSVESDTSPDPAKLEPDSISSGPDEPAPAPLSNFNSPPIPLSSASRLVPDANDTADPLPTPLLPPNTCTDPAIPASLDPDPILTKPDPSLTDSPLRTLTAPDDALKDSAPVSAREDEGDCTNTSPVRNPVLLDTENRRLCDCMAPIKSIINDVLST